jgi:hypothetical protein
MSDPLTFLVFIWMGVIAFFAILSVAVWLIFCVILPWFRFADLEEGEDWR